MSAAARLIPIDDDTPPESLDPTPSVVVIGNFDGVHQGHRAVLVEAVSHARKNRMAACVLTFDPHPGSVVGRGAPPRLTTLEHRAELLGELGVDRMYVRRFDAPFAGWEPERFSRELVARELRARLVVVGENFRFGAKRSGDLGFLRRLGAELGFNVRVHAVAADERGPYSSTRAREAIAAGDVDEAAHVLGRPHALTGVVVEGDRRGRTIQVPTANLDAIAELLPARGVYAVGVERAGPTGVFAPLGHGLTNIGVRPTVGGGRLSVETFVLDFSADLYGARLRLNLRARLREERKFASLDELKAQIARDVTEARAALSGS